VKSPETRSLRLTANGLEFHCYELGEGPLALLLHGFPDTAHTWRYLMPDLADAGFRAVAPFMRGYAPTSTAPDGQYQAGALAADACALHEALEADGDAVIVGHDWGAVAAYGAVVAEPERWSRIVAIAVPPGPIMAKAFFDYDQIKRSFYMFYFQTPLAEMAIAADDFRFVKRLWSDWSPLYDSTEDVGFVRESLKEQPNLHAAIGYYRALFDPSSHDPSLARFQTATAGVPTQPTLYLHGERDGCIGAEFAEGVEQLLPQGSRVVVLPNVGHFLHLEAPQLVCDAVVSHLRSST
jgi:pimeloyl-ACP methyl ester carboxylesterase